MIGAPFQHPFPPRRSRQEPGRRIVILRATNTHITPHIQARQTRRTGQKEDTTSRVVIEKPHVRPSARLGPLRRRPQKPLLNDDYAARRSICAVSAVEGMYVVGTCGPRGAAMVRRVRLPASTLRPHGASAAPGGGGLQTTRPNFRVAVLLKYRSNAHDVVRGHMLTIPARLGRSESFWAVAKVRSPHTGPEPGYPRPFPRAVHVSQCLS